MRTVLIILFLGALNIHAQTWYTVKKEHFNESHQWCYSGEDNKAFKINPVDNTLWFGYGFGHRIYQIDVNGNYTVHTDQTDAEIHNLVFPSEFAFTSDGTVYMADSYTGRVLAFDGSDWTVAAFTTDAQFISSDVDSVWICQNPGDVHVIEDGNTVAHLYGSNRIQSRDGVAYSTTGYGGGFNASIEYLRKYIPNVITTTALYYYSDSTPYLLDDKNYDFKFAKNLDILYTSGDQGFSLAFNHVFFDTLTRYNTTNMPLGGIVEFEFDQNDNIWAMFGTDRENFTHIAYLDRTSDTWSMVYDENNSPINFTELTTIEVDGNGNLYVMQKDEFHVLDVNNAPSWLSIDEVNSEEFKVFPNPSDGSFEIQTSSLDIDYVSIHDLSGKEVERHLFTNEINTNLETGVYLLRLMQNQAIIGTSKVIIE